MRKLLRRLTLVNTGVTGLLCNVQNNIFCRPDSFPVEESYGCNLSHLNQHHRQLLRIFATTSKNFQDHIIRKFYQAEIDHRRRIGSTWFCYRFQNDDFSALMSWSALCLFACKIWYLSIHLNNTEKLKTDSTTISYSLWHISVTHASHLSYLYRIKPLIQIIFRYLHFTGGNQQTHEVLGTPRKCNLFLRCNV